MNPDTHTLPESVNVRLTLDMTYVLNGEDRDNVLIRLHKRCERAIEDGLFTGGKDAKVDTWWIDIDTPPSKAESAALEVEIASYMRQRIEDGNLDAEDLPARLARYGLMAPEAFVYEMRERMGTDDGAGAVIPATDPSSTEPIHGEEREMQVAVACFNASGKPDMPVFTVRITEEEYDRGAHYDKAETLAQAAEYDGPFVCFDAAEQGAILSAARELGLVPQVVAVDLTDRQIQSIRCDAGEIKVICYNTADLGGYSSAMAVRPVGQNGQLVRCWAHAQLAQVDQGLKLARD